MLASEQAETFPLGRKPLLESRFPYRQAFH